MTKKSQYSGLFVRPVGIIRVLVVFAGLVGFGHTSEACDLRDPPSLDIRTNFYSDERGSIIDPSKLAQRMVELKPARDLVRFVIDLEPEGALDCLARNYGKWAEQGYLLNAPDNFVAAVERQRIVLGLSIPAVLASTKQHRSAFPETTKLWLASANSLVADYFVRRGRVDNLYAWSISNGTATLFFARDAHLESVADEMWAKAVDFISADGSLNSELKRGVRALIYHEYYLSALLVSGALRASLGKPTSDKDVAKLVSLADYVSKNACDPRELEARAAVRQMDPLSSRDVVFRAYLGNTMRLQAKMQCFPFPAQSYVDFFGSLKKIAAALTSN